MTTAEFIAKTYNTKNDKWGRYGYDRWCSSVKTDKHGVVYSYGRHYPLAFHVAGLDFINVSGYSNTTSKHINWAWQAVGYHAIPVKLWTDEAEAVGNEYITDDRKLEAIQAALQREHDELVEKITSKKRKDTQVYAGLIRDLHTVAESLHEVKEARA